MKKTLIALAVLSAAGVAAAQSSVTLYGVADFGTKFSSGKTSTTDAAGKVSSTKTSDTNLFGNDGQYASNRIGLKGTEDLGGGLKGGFNYEMGVNADATATGGAFAGSTRLANLYVEGGFGKVTIGTFMNNIDTVRGISPTNTHLTGDIYADTGRNNGRSINSLGYTFNRNNIWAGVDVGYTNTKKTDAAGDSVTTKWQGYTLGAGYNDGTLNVGAAYAAGKTNNFTTVRGVSKTTSTAAVIDNPKTPDEDESKAAVVNEGKYSDAIVGASYKIGMFTPFAFYEQSKLTGSDGNGLTGNATPSWAKNNAWTVGSSFDLGATTAWAAVGMGKTKWKGSNTSLKTTAAELGAAYALSKRTTLYGIYNYQQDKKRTPNTLAGDKAKNHALTAGINHKF